MRKIAAAALAMALGLAGCATTTLQELKDNPARQLSFEVNQDYLPVYRAMLAPARACFQRSEIPLVRAAMAVQSDLVPEQKSGEIQLLAYGNVHAAIFVREAGLGRTAVRIITTRNPEMDEHVMKAWATEGSTRCP